MDISVTITPEVAGPIKQPYIQKASTPRNTQQFSAEVKNDPANAGVIWSIEQGGGVITPEGAFHPPLDNGLGKSTIHATSVTDKTKFAKATVTYTDKLD